MFTTPEKVETMVVAINYVLLTTEKMETIAGSVSTWDLP
jgi:hypothetical protein